jgi:mannose-6-phosphate isomerase-like protein (cupin superfamily)
VLEGTLRVTVGDRELDAPAGNYILVPPGIVHTFANTTAAPARVLNLNAPGGWERHLRELAGAMRSGAFPGTAASARLVANYDFVVPA